MTSHCSHARTGNIASILMSWKHYAFIVECEMETWFIQIMFAMLLSILMLWKTSTKTQSYFPSFFYFLKRTVKNEKSKRKLQIRYCPVVVIVSSEEDGWRLVDGDRIESWQTAPRVPASQLQRAGAADIPRSRTQYICQKKYLRSKSGRIFLDCIMWQKPDIKPLKLVTFVSNLFQIHSLALSTSQPI